MRFNHLPNGLSKSFHEKKLNCIGNGLRIPFRKVLKRTVAFLVSMRADCGAVTDPSPAFPLGRPAADLASTNGHKGISGFLAECSLTQNLESLKVDDQKGGRQEISGIKVVQTVSERTATPMLYGDMPDALCLKDSLTAVRNATQAADRIHQVFRMQSFQRKLLTQYEGDDELGLSDQQALSLLASRAYKSGQGHGLANAAAIHIQKKFRGWKKRKEFLMIRQRVVKIQVRLSALFIDFFIFNTVHLSK